jgi:CDP-glucose 4,6-dehydratase
MVTVNQKLSFYRDKRVFVTGHTGFKGSWLCTLLNQLGAKVKGYALSPDTNPSHFEILDLEIESEIGDIRNLTQLKASMKSFKPDIVLHLAAQPLVRYSYENPIETYETNVMGTLNVLEAVRDCDSIKAVVNVTTDKCYKNNEWVWPYREKDELGGYDPYSSSKACSEILTDSYRNSFFNINDFGTKHNCLIASARAGNVIGGGDWSIDRIIPDIIRSKVEDSTLHIRNPKATRPWQHVLEPLVGYLALGYHLLNKEIDFADAWNFGPDSSQVFSVENVVDAGNKLLDNSLNVELNKSSDNPHEANLLMLDSAKAHKFLNWRGHLNFDATIEYTFNWYKEFYNDKKIITKEQINNYLERI